MVVTKVLRSSFVSSERKTSGNYNLNQVVVSSGFSENEKKREGVTYASKVGTVYVPIHQVPTTRGWVGYSVSRAHKTCSRSFLLKAFPYKSVGDPYGYGRRFEDIK